MKVLLVTFLLRLTAVQCGYNVTYSSTNICGLKGTSVVLPCEYDYPHGRGDTYLRGEWYKEDKGSVRGHDNLKYPDCDLKLDRLSETDAGVYRFRFYTALHLGWITSTPVITLSVTDLKVEEVAALNPNQTDVNCSTSCSLGSDTEFVWYKNGQHLSNKSTAAIPLDSEVARYSCAVRGHEHLLSPAVCVPHKHCWGVTYSNKNICVLMGTKVNIPCSYLHPKDDRIEQTIWFHYQKLNNLYLNKHLKKDLEYHVTEENSCTLSLENITESHTGEYGFRFTTEWRDKYSGLPGVNISVTALWLFAPVDAVKEGDKVTLTCNTTCSLSKDPTFIWYKNGQSVSNKHTSRDNKLHLNPVSSEDAGSYSCAVRGHENLTSTAVLLEVRYKAKNVFVSITPSTILKEGSSVTLTCGSDANPPVQNYTWYMKSGAESLVRGTGESISFNVTSDTSGLYYCEAHNEEGSQSSSEVAVETGAASILLTAITIFIILVVLLFLGIAYLSSGNTESAADPRTANANIQLDLGLVYSRVRFLIPDLTPRVSARDQDDAQYANIQNRQSNSQEGPLYSNILTQTSRTATRDYIDYTALRGTAATSAKDDGVTYSAVHRC